MKGLSVAHNRFYSLTAAIVLLLAALAMPRASHAQAAVYGEFSVTDMHNLVFTDQLYGATTGVLIDGPTFHHIVLSGDIQGRFVHKSGEDLDGATIGPRFTVMMKHGWAPYGEFMVGFARYNKVNYASATSDSTIQANAGVGKRISPRFDLVADYSYSQYYALGGQFNPKTFSVGTIFHFVKR